MDNDSTVLDQPESTTTDTERQPFADLQPETSDETTTGQVQTTEETAPTEETAEEAYQLPDEQLKVFPDNIYQEYAAKRYPNLAPILADPNNPQREAVRQIIHDALNKDIWIENAKQAEEEPAEEETEETDQPEPTQAPDPAAAAAQLERAIDDFTEKVTDPEIAVKYFKAVNDALSIKDPREQAIAYTKVQTRAVVNLMRDLLPAFLEGRDGQQGWLDKQIAQHIDQNFEGLGESHVTNARSSFWDGLRTSPEFKAANLPAFGSPEWLASLDKVAALMPGFEKAVFTDANGKPLTRLQNWQEKAKVHARLLAGTATTGTVTKATKAVETGKRLERESTQRKGLANLGAGQSKGQIAPGAQPGGIDQARKEAIARHRADENPFASLNPQK